ncbi:MAG: hypothetical protein WC824_07870 [Bacteroidota bacterium]|jgi:hypothetical protein
MALYYTGMGLIQNIDLVRKLRVLLDEAFPLTDTTKDPYSIVSISKPPIDEVIFRLQKEPLRTLKLSIGTEGTVAMLVVGNPQLDPRFSGQEHISVDREILLNSCWDSFVGWVSYIKTIYEEKYRGSDTERHR